MENLSTNDWLSYYADIAAGAVQYGGRTALCDYMKPVDGKDDQTVAQKLVDYGNENGNNPADYDRDIVASH